jgi:ABC-type dipeptide/oligopeptide/nickel transport system permease component
MILAMAFLLINLLVDVLYVYLDPRAAAVMSVETLGSLPFSEARTAPRPLPRAASADARQGGGDRHRGAEPGLLAAAFAPLIAPYDPYFTDLTIVMQPPNEAHWFGTDNTGRDILSRVLYGTRNTLMLGLVGVLIGGVLGRRARHLAAFYVGLDGWIMRLVDIMLAFPAILIGLAVAAIFGAGLTAVVIALVVATVPDVARVARGAAVGVMGQEFIEAGRAVGVSTAR